jgi:hypothetical protein
MFALLESGHRDVANAISGVCEMVWLQRNREHRERIVPQTIVVVLLEAVSGGDSAADGARRALSVADMLSMLDLHEDSARSVRTMLVRLALEAPVMASPDGRRLLAHCFTLDESLVPELHDAIKVQLPTLAAGDDALPAAFAEVYVRAWRQASPAMRAVIERVCMQDLCSVAICCANADIVRGTLSVLRHVHQDRQRQHLDGMLLRAYEPLLFRALTAANTQVRVNATALLADAFPLQDPDAPQAETDATLQSQLDALDALLSDPAASVRVCAVRAAARWLSVYWEMMPREVHLAMLRRLLKLSHDSNAPAVRAAVCDAFAFVLTQHLAQSLLAQALPKLEHLVDDRSALVRAAFLGLMLEVKKIKAIKFYETAAPDRLLARLAVDESARTQAAVAELLQPTFFAHNKPARQQAERALFLLHTQPLAAPKFFAGACAVAGSSAAARLIGYLTRRLTRALEQGPVPPEALDGDVEHVFINDYATVHALLCTINAMWLAIRPSDATHKPRAAKQSVDEITTLLRLLWTDDLLCQLWRFYALRPDSSGAQTMFEPIAQLAARLPRATVPNFHAAAMTALGVVHSSDDVPGDATACGGVESMRSPAQLRALSRCLAAWGVSAQLVGAQFARIAAFLGESERADADADAPQSPPVADDMLLPLQILSASLVCHEALRSATLEHERGAHLLFVLLRRLWRSEDVSVELLAQAASVCARHALHSDLARASTAGEAPQLGVVLLWISSRALRRVADKPLTDAQQSALAQLMCIAAEAGAVGLGALPSDADAAAPAAQQQQQAPPALTLRDVPDVCASFAVDVLERLLQSRGVDASVQSSADARVCLGAAVKMSVSWMTFGAYEAAQRVYDMALQARTSGSWSEVAVPDTLTLLSGKRSSPEADNALSYHVQAVIDALSSPHATADDTSSLADVMGAALAVRNNAKSLERAQKLWSQLGAAVRARLIDSDDRLVWRAAAKARLVDFCALLLVDKHVKDNAEAQRCAASVRGALAAFHDALAELGGRVEEAAHDGSGGGDDDDDDWRLNERATLFKLQRTVARMI